LQAGDSTGSQASGNWQFNEPRQAKHAQACCRISSECLNTACLYPTNVSVFGDALALTFSDSDHSMDEDRSRTYGVSNKERLLVVVHTERRNSIRIISARKATRHEKYNYKNG
jgi:uncharacterized DUF497 family protein